MHAETFNAGNVNGSWDGLDDFGTPVPSGSYRKVLRNGALYNNIGVIGNTGLPPVTSGHVPYFIEGVAVDAQGKIYTVHDWDEPHFDVIRWSPVDGKSEMNTGHAISEALLKGIAVEPDGSIAYVTGYGDSLRDRTKSKFSIWRISMAPGLGESQRVINFTQQRRATGNYQSTISGIRVACGVAIGPNGNIWVGHEHTKVSVYSSAGVWRATPITDLTEVRSLSIQGNTLAVADRVGEDPQIHHQQRHPTHAAGHLRAATETRRPETGKTWFHQWNGAGRIGQHHNFRPSGRRFAAAEDWSPASSRLAADVPRVLRLSRLRKGQSGSADLQLSKGVSNQQSNGDMDLARAGKNRCVQEVFWQVRIDEFGASARCAIWQQRFLLLSCWRFSRDLSC
jgi:hypothetical protein